MNRPSSSAALPAPARPASTAQVLTLALIPALVPALVLALTLMPTPARAERDPPTQSISPPVREASPEASAVPQRTPLASRPEVRAFVEDLARRQGLPADATLDLLSEAHVQPTIIALMDRHVTGEPSWLRYRARFVTARRIQDGVAFMASHEAALDRASRTYGVSAEIIAAIIGVETAYGRNTGSYRVLDALTTLAFDYPRRSAFFRDELEAFLIHARDDRVDARAIRGSYAGAIGIPQFMPGSILRWAVDFDHDGRRDLVGSAEDAIGSVARYLQGHGWQAGEPSGWLARAQGEDWRSRVSPRFEPSHTVAELGQYGIHAQPGAGKPAAQTRVALVALDSPGVRPTLYLATANFEAITRYNRSSFYAMAVVDLAAGIATERRGRRSR